MTRHTRNKRDVYGAVVTHRPPLIGRAGTYTILVSTTPAIFEVFSGSQILIKITIISVGRRPNRAAQVRRLKRVNLIIPELTLLPVLACRGFRRRY